MRINSQSKFLTLSSLALLSIVMTACERADPAAELVTANEVDKFTTSLEHVAVAEGYTIHANIIRSDKLPPAMMEQYGIEAGSDRGLMNVVVLQEGPDGRDVTVAADVSAQQQNLVGHSREIGMKAVIANGSTSYIGSFESSPQEFFRFTVTARPVGSDKTLLIEFEERVADLADRVDLNTSQ